MTPTLTDYQTGAPIRPATREEWQRSKDAAISEPGGAGTFILDGRIVFVAGDFPTPALVCARCGSLMNHDGACVDVTHPNSGPFRHPDHDAAETPAPAPTAKYRLRCTFIPQAWVNKYAVTVDPEGPTSWDTDWFGAALPAPNDYESDQLRDGADAPRWVKDWSGPFEVEYEVIPDTTETPAPAPTAHTPEPWSTRRNDDGSALAYEVTVNHGKGLVAYVVGYNVYDGTDDPETEANAARIVAAVNACAGIEDPGATLASIAGFLEDVARGCDPDDARDIAADLLALLGEK